MNYLVTGGAGFIGSHLSEALIEKGNSVVVIDNLSRGKFNSRIIKEIKGRYVFKRGDVTNYKFVKNIFRENAFDVVFHLAALPSHRHALERPYEYIHIDLMGTENILEAARLSQKKPLVVFASSNKVYGKQKCPWKEDKLPQPEGPYAVAKWSAEKLCEMYHKYFNLPTLILRYHHVAGARSNPELALSVFVEQALKNQPLEVHGLFKNQSFESCSANYTDVRDAIRASLLAVKKYKTFEIFNIANKRLIKVAKIAELVVKKLNSKSKIVTVPLLPHETLEHRSNLSKAEKQLGFVASIPVEKAIDDYIEWRLKKVRS